MMIFVASGRWLNVGDFDRRSMWEPPERTVPKVPTPAIQHDSEIPGLIGKPTTNGHNWRSFAKMPSKLFFGIQWVHS